ncbi:MAG: fused MFS/spermidine synthase [Myxococcota bacterium]
MLRIAATVVSSAFLLFLVQPLVGKVVLPWFGGAPAVWTTCLLFFQVVLLGGYAWSHLVVRRLRGAWQRRAHLALLAVAVAALVVSALDWGTPLVPSAALKPAGSESPTLRLLGLLFLSVGLPYFTLSSTGPLLQAWVAQRVPTATALRLYSASNLGSLVGLLAFPIIFEPLWPLKMLAWSWSVGFVAFAVACAAIAWRAPEVPRDDVREERLPARRVLAWVLLAAFPSSLLLATTNHLTQDVAPVPFLWVAPLVLYLGSFVLTFDHARWYRRGLVLPALGAFGVLAAGLSLYPTEPSALLALVGYLGFLFLGCVAAHGELVRRRPPGEHLTAFYLAVSSGGALGGLLVAVVAPRVTSDFVELPLSSAGLVLAVALAAVSTARTQRPAAPANGPTPQKGSAVPTAAADGHRSAPSATSEGPAIDTSANALVGDSAGTAQEASADGANPGSHHASADSTHAASASSTQGASTREASGHAPHRSANGATDVDSAEGDATRLRGGGRAVLAGAALLAVLFGWSLTTRGADVLLRRRDFFGVLRVERDPKGTVLMHGRVMHGAQWNSPDKRRLATAYFSPGSGIGRLLAARPGPLRVGIIGLGAGTLAAYARDGDVFRFYEISPSVVEVAQGAGGHFTFLSDAPRPPEVVLGDARTSLEAEASNRYDVFVLDAFSGDSVPAHLLTKEAFLLYQRHLAADASVLALHVSNRYLRLLPVVTRLARELGLHGLVVESPAGEGWALRALWVLLSRDAAALKVREDGCTTARVDELPQGPLWTDEHTSLWGLVDW